MGLQELMKNPYAWVILSVCTIASLILAVYTWIVGKKKKEISYFYKTFAIVKAGKNIVPQLTLLYEGKDIDDLTVTKYAIWNSGNEVLNWSDIVVAKSLKIVSNEPTKILDAKILLQSNETNIFKITDKKDNCINISFDYAEINDGIIIQILHTGDATNINVECRIKGGKKLKNLNRDKKKRNRNKRNNYRKDMILILILMGVMVFTMCVSVVLVVLTYFGIISKQTVKAILFLDSSFDGIFTMLVSFIGVGALLICYLVMLKEVLYIGIPTKLRRYIDYDIYDDTETTN